jgi:putative membrane protein
MAGERSLALLPLFGKFLRRSRGMWGCGNFPFVSWMSGVFPGGVFSIFLWTLIILALVFLAMKLIGPLRSHPTGYRDRNDSFEILKMRYAKGELSLEEYTTMKGILEQSQ